MPKRLLCLLLVIMSLVAACSTVRPTPEVAPQRATEVAPSVPLPAPDMSLRDETPALYFVEFEGGPRARGRSAAALRNQRTTFRNAAAAEAIRYRERANFERLFNGLSVAATPAELAKLSRLPGVSAVYPVITIDAPEPEVSSGPEMAYALDMTGASVAQELGLSGRGIKVGIIDSGIDLQHPDFAGRIGYGRDFVGDAYNAADPENNIPRPGPTPDDCGGHGTHVAGIVGASGGVTGVAPEVTLGAYRVFGCSGSSSADIIIQAMEQALEDGMDVVNMSLGAAFQWPQYPTAQAANTLVDAGVVVVASIGNSGTSGTYAAGAPGVGEKVIGVASFDNTFSATNSFRLPDGRQVGYRPLSVTPTPPTSGTAPEIVYVGRGCNTDSYMADPSGKVALTTRGECPFNEKYQRAVAAGAVGVIIENNAPGNFAGGGVEGVAGRFGVAISQEDGAVIKGLTAATITWTDETLAVQNPTGNLISSFSSYGLTADLDLKPDLGAPGGLIRSTYPLELGGYAVLSGTSMSSPHVAGAVALLLEHKPTTSAAEVRTLFQNNAEPRPWSLNATLPALDSVHRQGAGMINIPATLDAAVTVSPGKLALGAGTGGTRTLTVRNTSDQAVSYTLSHANNAIATTGSVYTPGFAYSAASANLPASVTVPARSSATVTVSVSANPNLPDFAIYGGYLVLTPAEGSVAPTLRVPYAGFKGNYQALPILTPTQFNFPWLARRTDTGSYSRVLEGDASFSMKGEDIAYLLVHLEHHARLLKIDIVPLRQVGGARDLRVIESDYLARNTTPNGFFAYAWDGSGKVNGRRTPLPMGDYKLRLTVQKPLGGPSDVEVWESPVITIRRSN